jgi:Methyltransferase domain
MTARPADDAPVLSAKVDEALTEYVSSYTDPRWQAYLALHPARYRFLIARVVELLARLPAEGGPPRLLVIGPRFEVDLIRRVAPTVRIDTLGLNPGLYPPREGERQFIFDLSHADDPQARPQAGPYELIVMAEVLEHVPMPPSIVLPWLRSLLVPGGILLVQTPNAVALPNRVRMLAGRQPFQMLSVERDYPGHFREYTIAELVREGKAAGFEISSVLAANYFGSNKRSNRVFRRFERIVPRTLRAGITIIYRAPAPVG